MNRNVTVLTALAVSTALGLGAWLSSREATASPPAKAGAASPPGVVPAAPPGASQRALEAEIALGEHLVSTSGCHDCHTPWKLGANGPEPDMSRMLSGHPEAMKVPPPPPPAPPWIVSILATNTAYAGPWGVSFTANLTPDDETGLGTWTRETFIQTIRTGRHMGRGRPLLPPMPVPVYRNFSDDELGAIHAYLRTIPKHRNRVPEPMPPAPAPAPARPKRG